MKYLLVFLLGFLTHKVVNYTYDYYWWKASYGCKNSRGDIQNHFDCIYKEMGVIKYSGYLLIRPVPSTNRMTYSNRKWEF